MSAEPFLRARLNEKIRLRRMPVMSFVHDDSIEYSAKISKLIDEVSAKDRANAEQRGRKAKMPSKQEILQNLSGSDDFLIIGHVSPDGDTVGSSLALCLGLWAWASRSSLACTA